MSKALFFLNSTFSVLCFLCLSHSFNAFSQSLSAKDWEKNGFKSYRKMSFTPAELGVLKTNSIQNFFSLDVIFMEDASWKIQEIQKNIRETLNILSQCDIGVKSIDFHQIENYKGTSVLYRFPNSKEVNSTMGLVTSLPLSKKNIRIFFISKFIERPSAGKAFGFWPDKRLDNYLDTPLPGTVWITNKIMTQKYQEKRKSFPYNIVAHEMLHVLTGIKQHLSPQMYPPNLLSTFISHTRNNYILPEHCALIKETIKKRMSL